jgi:hypothetical protein
MVSKHSATSTAILPSPSEEALPLEIMYRLVRLKNQQYKEGSHKLRVMGISCQGIAASNMYYARTMNENIKEVRYWKHLRVKGFRFRVEVMITIYTH